MKTLKRVYFLFFQWHRSHIFLEMNTTLKSLLPDGHLDRRRPWPRRCLRDPRKPISGKTFPFNRFFELIHSTLCTWADAWKFSLSSNKREIVPKHYSLPLPDPATSESLVGEVTQYANWLKGKGAWSQCLSKSRSGWLLKETRSCFQMNYNGPSCFHKLPQPL